MITIVKNISFDVDLSPEEVAAVFCGMDEHEQASFFSSIAEQVQHWKNHIDGQLLRIARSSALTAKGRRLMQTIGAYADETV